MTSTVGDSPAIRSIGKTYHSPVFMVISSGLPGVMLTVVSPAAARPASSPASDAARHRDRIIAGSPSLDLGCLDPRRAGLAVRGPFDLQPLRVGPGRVLPDD